MKAVILALTLALASCGSPQHSEISQIASRAVLFPDYPQSGYTYLSFSKAHGFQVNYLGSGGKAWLWYPGNTAGVPEEWKRSTVGNTPAVCWRHPRASYNPVTKTSGGDFACEALSFAQKTIIARLQGDVYNLASGAIPYRRSRCAAPDEFLYDKERFAC